MNKSKMVVAGDSWGEGAELIDPVTGNYNVLSYNDKHIFPYYLNKKLKFDFIQNLSESGISNDHIYELVVQTVIESRESFPSDELFVLVGWTSPERRLFKLLNEHEVNLLFLLDYIPGEVNGDMFNENSNFYIQEVVSRKKRKELIQFFKIYNKYFWSVKESLDRWVYQMITLHRFLMSYNIKHLFYNNFYPYDSMYNFFKDFRGDTIFQSDVDEYFGVGDHVPLTKRKEALMFTEPIKSGNKLMFDENQQKLFSAIPKKYVYPDTILNVLRSKYEGKEPPSMYLSSIKENNPALCEGGHPNELGHKEMSDILYKHIKKHGLY